MSGFITALIKQRRDAKKAGPDTSGRLKEIIDIIRKYDYDDDTVYILIKGDVTENSAKYAADNHEDLLQTMKNDDFQAKIDSWIEEIGISENSEAIKRYTAKVVYDKQNEFYNQ